MQCIFCDIIARTEPSRIFYENQDVIVFQDHRPRAPTHLLICPKMHYVDLIDAPPEIMPRMFEAVKTVSDMLQTGDAGFRLVINNGANAGQIVFHLHFHFLTSRKTTWKDEK